MPRDTGNGNNWQLLFSMGALMFGLLTPVYMMVQGTNAAIAEHKVLQGHPKDIEDIATLNEHAKEVETQFRGVRELIDLEHKRQDGDLEEMHEWRILHEDRGSLSDARQWERLRFLEREVFGKEVPTEFEQ